MKRFNLLIAIGIATVGVTIGYYTNTPIQTLQASDVPMPRYVDVPRTGKELSLIIDLKSDKVLVSENSKDATVTINKDVEIHPVYLPKEIEVEKLVYVESKTRVNQLLNRYAPMKLPKFTIPEDKR